jgi:alpha-L-fucosidase
MRYSLIAVLWLAVLLPFMSQAPAADRGQPSRLDWWTEARFGMFIHWGIYTVPAGEWNGHEIEGLGEWIMNRAKIPVRDYEKLAAQFNPVQFDAEKWVSIAKNAGMKYITITAKHHDGFAMYGSKVSPYNVVDATPFHRDPMKELAAACQRQGLKLCFYYSQTQDWHEPDAVGNDWDFPNEGSKNFQKYYDEKVIPQVRELLTNYGPIGLIWFDTPRNITLEQSQKLADLVHMLQPQCLVSGRVGHGLGDYDSAGDNQISVGAVKRPWETPVTLNDTWGFKKNDHNWKSSRVLIQQLATTSSRGGNYLLNVGPTSQGVVPPESVERLQEVGKWMAANSESIHATSANPFPYELPWGVITTKPGKLYLHIFNWPQNGLTVYGIQSKLQHALLLANHAPVAFSQKEDKANGVKSLNLKLPLQAPDEADSVIALDITGGVEVDASLQQQPDGTITLPAQLSELHRGPGSKAQMDSRGVMEHWTSAQDWAQWSFKVNAPGTFDVELITSQQKYGRGWDGAQRVALDVASQKLSAVVADDGKLDNPSNPYWPYINSKVGRVRIEKSGKYDLSLKPEEIPAGQMYGLTLVSIRLLPVLNQPK